MSGRNYILGVPVSSIDMQIALDRIGEWIAANDTRYVCVADVHSVMRARGDQGHMAVMNSADMITPDGTPLVWVSRLRGDRRIRRVCGPDLMLEACARSAETGWKHYLLGGAEGIPEALRVRLESAYPKLEIVGQYSPPFRPLTPEEDAKLVAEIRGSGANILWIGLGCPKQEKWMAEHRSLLPGITQIGVGAAFNFHVGSVKRAPKWLRDNGLEWMHRLASEPKRLWRRYLIDAPKFLVFALSETFTKR